MTLVRIVLLLACPLAFAACRNPRDRAAEHLRKVGAERLRRDAAILYKETFSGHGTDFMVIKAKDWPPTFQAFAPIRVGAYPDGISLALQARHDTEAGLYVVPHSMDHEPRGARGATFQKLADGIYWYSFGDY